MRILPVIDLLGGHVVRGIAGNRQSYRPIVSQLARDSSPRAVAMGLVETFGFSDVYIADLDAIAGAPPAWNDYAAIGDSGLRLWVDAGVGDAQQAAALTQPQQGRFVHCVIVGLESLKSTSALATIAEMLPPEQRVFSLDLKHGRPLTSITAWSSATPLDIAASAYAAGFRRLIVLDLARVGVGEGTGTRELCSALRSRFPDMELISGGGVRDVGDLETLAADGLDYLLVASALHDGRITPSDVSRWR